MTTRPSGCLLPWQPGSRVHLHHMYAGKSSASMISTTTSVGGTRLCVAAGRNGSSILRMPSPTVPSQYTFLLLINFKTVDVQYRTVPLWLSRSCRTTPMAQASGYSGLLASSTQLLLSSVHSQIQQTSCSKFSVSFLLPAASTNTA
jgi:hypothetical protein